MIKFVLEDSIVKNTKEELVEYLKSIVSEIENGQEFGLLNHEGNQCASWEISEDEEGIVF